LWDSANGQIFGQLKKLSIQPVHFLQKIEQLKGEVLSRTINLGQIFFPKIIGWTG
jgi:hypothetical protein